MGNALWLNLGEMLRVNATKYPRKMALRDHSKSITFSKLNARVNKLAHLLLKLGLEKGDKISCLLENCPEIVELYLATAKTGIIINPINFRLSAVDINYIINNADSKAFFVHREFIPQVNSIRKIIPQVKYYFAVEDGSKIAPEIAADYMDYEKSLSDCVDDEPHCIVKPEDIWVLLYTSGTTGNPKGVLRSHESYIAFYLINAGDFSFTPNDICLNVMPLCHVNSTFFSFTIIYLGGSVYIHPARNFDPVEILQIIEREKITFISLIPTHYHLILNVPEETCQKINVSSIKSLLCSSAPARGDIKKRVMDYFKGVLLYEAYGSTEAGIVTVLRPEEQLTKAGSIGMESGGTDCIKLLDVDKKEVPIGQVGELYSRGPMLFSGYYSSAVTPRFAGRDTADYPRQYSGKPELPADKMPEKTKSSFCGEWFSAGDMAKKDTDGYYYLVDRKDNLIISGGEHIYPSEVEEVLMRHPKVFEAAVIGTADEKWGEKVTAVVILKPNTEATENEIIEFCRDKMAGYKKPKSVKFIASSDMPRTASGKILHRQLRKMFS